MSRSEVHLTKIHPTHAATDVVGRQRGNWNQKDKMKFREKKMLVKHAAELSR